MAVTVPVGSKTFTYAELTGSAASSLGIDPTKRELYLADDEFQKSRSSPWPAARRFSSSVCLSCIYSPLCLCDCVSMRVSVRLCVRSCAVFGKSKADFNKDAQWRRDQEKRKAKLF